jgi:hypothetical protein
MVHLNLDPQGRLIEFSAVPPQLEVTPAPPGPANWTTLLSEAGLDMSRFAPAEPRWLPLVSFDARAAWTGSYANAPEIPLRIEAASWRGRPVNFQVIAPWSRPTRMQPVQRTPGEAFASAAVTCLLLVSWFLAWRNLRLQRGDTRGAARLAGYILVLRLLLWLCGASHVPTLHEVWSFWQGLAQSVEAAVNSWIYYVAMEPYVRRRWPQIMIAWSRLLGGGVRDALVGGHVLIGIATGIGLALWAFVVALHREGSGVLSTETGLDLYSLLDVRRMTFVLINKGLIDPIFLSLLFLLFFFLPRMVFRRMWLAAAAVIIIGTFVVYGSVGFDHLGLFDYVSIPLWWALMVFVLTRFGVLALAVAFSVSAALYDLPLTADLSTWYAGTTLFAIASVLALTAYALYTALAGRPLLKTGFLEND